MLFAVGFGLVFITAGLKRMFGVGPDGPKLESILWGVVGILIGAGLIAEFAWLLFGPPLQAPEPMIPFDR